jgi:hypothetical protein
VLLGVSCRSAGVGAGASRSTTADTQCHSVSAGC